MKYFFILLHLLVMANWAFGTPFNSNFNTFILNNNSIPNELKPLYLDHEKDIMRDKLTPPEELTQIYYNSEKHIIPDEVLKTIRTIDQFSHHLPTSHLIDGIIENEILKLHLELSHLPGSVLGCYTKIVLIASFIKDFGSNELKFSLEENRLRLLKASFSKKFTNKVTIDLFSDRFAPW